MEYRVLTESLLSRKHKLLKNEHKTLSRNYKNLWNAYQILLANNNSQQAQIRDLQLQIEHLKSNKDLESENLMQLARDFYSKKTTSLLSPSEESERANTRENDRQRSLGDMAELDPNESINTYMDSCLLEALIIVSPPEGNPKSPPKIIWEFPKSPEVLTPNVRTLLPEFCLPKNENENQKALKLTGSATELNSLFFGPSPTTRDNNFYIFTMRSEETPMGFEWADMPNSSKEIIYAVCLKVNDIDSSRETGKDYKISKCYCLLTYIPLFELHYEFLTNLLLIKKLNRIETIETLDTTEINKTELVSEDMVYFLKRYQEWDDLSPCSYIEISSLKTDPVIYKTPDDLSEIDIPWLCCPLFAVLSPEEVLWILSALLQENSVVVVSEDLGLSTSCVLAFQALLRPLEWPNILIPTLPEKLSPLLDSPVPVLAGANFYHSLPESILWIRLDEHEERYLGPVSEVVSPVARNLRSQLSSLHFSTRDSPEHRNATIQASRYFKDFIELLLSGVSNTRTSNLHENLVATLGLPEEKEFFRLVCKTQMFTNTVQSFLIYWNND